MKPLRHPPQLLDALAEQQIREAQARGEFEGLPGAGAPLALDEDALVPEELRAGYRLLKNAGYVPPELEAHGEIREVEALLRAADNDAEQGRLLARLNALLLRAPLAKRGGLQLEADYAAKIAEKLARGR